MILDTASCGDPNQRLRGRYIGIGIVVIMLSCIAITCRKKAKS